MYQIFRFSVLAYVSAFGFVGYKHLAVGSQAGEVCGGLCCPAVLPGLTGEPTAPEGQHGGDADRPEQLGTAILRKNIRYMDVKLNYTVQLCLILYMIDFLMLQLKGFQPMKFGLRFLCCSGWKSYSLTLEASGVRWYLDAGQGWSDVTQWSLDGTAGKGCQRYFLLSLTHHLQIQMHNSMWMYEKSAGFWDSILGCSRTTFVGVDYLRLLGVCSAMQVDRSDVALQRAPLPRCYSILPKAKTLWTVPASTSSIPLVASTTRNAAGTVTSRWWHCQTHVLMFPTLADYRWKSSFLVVFYSILMYFIASEAASMVSNSIKPKDVKPRNSQQS